MPDTEQKWFLVAASALAGGQKTKDAIQTADRVVEAGRSRFDANGDPIKHEEDSE